MIAFHRTAPQGWKRGSRGFRIPIVLIATALVSWGGCASERSPYSNDVSQDGLVKIRGTGRDHLWVNRDHQLGRYDFILIKGVGFQYKAGQERLSADQEKAIGELLVETIRIEREGGPVGMTDTPGECVMAVTLGLMDLELHDSDQSGSVTSYVSSYGAATMVFELEDSLSNEILARYATRRGLGDGPGSGQSGADLGRLGRALTLMVRDMTEDLYSIIPTATQTDSNGGCHNGLLRLSGRG